MPAEAMGKGGFSTTINWLLNQYSHLTVLKPQDWLYGFAMITFEARSRYFMSLRGLGLTVELRIFYTPNYRMALGWKQNWNQIRKGLEFHVKYSKIWFTSVQMDIEPWKHFRPFTVADLCTVNDPATYLLPSVTVCHIDCIHAGKDSTLVCAELDW